MAAATSTALGPRGCQSHDVHPFPAPPGERLPGVRYEVLDVSRPEVGVLLMAERVDAVVHLAAVVTPKKGDAESSQC